MKLIKAIWKFIKSHVILTVLLGISVAIVFFYLLTLDVPEAFHNAGEWLIVLETLALSYIASFIFYILQVYAPEEQKMERINNCIYPYITDIVSYINGMFESIATHNIDHEPRTPFTKDEMDRLAAISSDTEIKVYKFGTEKLVDGKFEASYFDVRDWVLTQTYKVNSSIDHVMTYYGAYMDPDLLGAIEAIRKTEFMSHIVPFLQKGFVNWNGNHYWEFYEAGQKLKTVADQKLL